MPRVPTVERNTDLRPLPARNTGPQLGVPRLSLPNAPDTTGLVAQAQQNVARSVEKVADVFADMAYKAKRKADQTALIEAQRRLDEWENTTLYDPDTGALNRKGKDAFGLPDQLGTQYDEYAESLYSSLANDEQRIAFSQMANTRRDTAMRAAFRHERQEMDSYAKAETEAAIGSAVRRAELNYTDPIVVENSINNAKAAYTGWAKTQGLPQAAIDEKAFEIDRQARMAVLGRMAIENPEEIISKADGRRNPADAFDAAVTWVIQKEGGFVSNDAGKGPTKYGINKEANPDVDVQELTVAGAKALYKERYWKAIDADSLPPEMRLAAFDAAVNHGPGKAKEMLEQSGGDVDTFIGLRRAEYERLASQNPERYGQYLDGWTKRLDDLANSGGGASGIPSLDALAWKEQREIINAAESRLRQVRTKQRAELEGRVKDSEAMALAGVTDSNPPAREEFITAYGAEEGEKRFLHYHETREFGRTVNEVATQTPAQQATMLESMKPPAGEGFADRQKRYELLQKAMVETNKQRQDDPIAFALQKGLLEEDGGLNFNSASDFVSQMHRRADTAATMKHLYGTPLRAFTKSEGESLKSFLQTAQPEQQFALVTGMQQAFGKNLPEVLEPVADKDKVFAHYAGLASVDPERGPALALDAFRGRSILAQNPGIKVPDADSKARFREVVGNAFQYLPAAEAALYDSANALYVKRAFDAGQTDAFDPDVYEKAVQDAMGAQSDSVAFVEINDRVSVVPAGTNEDEFEDFLSILTPEDMLNFSVTGTGPIDGYGRQIRPEDLFEYGQFITVGNGMYKIRLPDGFVKTGNGVDDYVLMVTPERMRGVLAR